MHGEVAKILEWVRENCLDDDSCLELSAETDLLNAVGLDSLQLVHLAKFLESELDAKIEVEDMTPENFQSAQSIAAFISPSGPSLTNE